MVSLFVLFIRNTDYLAGYHASMRVGQPTLSPDRNVSIREKIPDYDTMLQILVFLQYLIMVTMLWL